MKRLVSKRSGITGWTIIAFFAICFDCLVIKQDKESLSMALWNGRKHPIYGPALLGTWLALTYHFFIYKPVE